MNFKVIILLFLLFGLWSCKNGETVKEFFIEKSQGEDSGGMDSSGGDLIRANIEDVNLAIENLNNRTVEIIARLAD